MIKFITKFLFVLLLTLIFVNQKAEAFWKLPFEIKIGSPSGNSVEGNEYYQTQQIAIQTLNNLISAYENKTSSRFMNFVSEDFTLDSSILSSSIRQDYLKYSYINIKVFVNSAVKSSDGKIAVIFNYTRTLEDRTAGKIVSDSGTTELILKKEGEVYKLYSMRKPYLFGITGI